MARGVDDGNRMIEPLDIGSSGLYRDAALPFKLHGVHGGANAVLAFDLVNGMDFFAIVEDTLGQGGFSRINVRTDADITHF
jgi:hypothetical protein